MSGERLLFVDGLRGVAACLVMLFHFESRVDIPLTGGLGFIGVSIFFALSGFVIAMTIADRQLSFKFLGRFALRRAVRLDIPYWICIALLILIAMFGAKFGANQAMPSLAQLGAHLIYAQDLLGYEPLSSVFWSLTFEIQFYLFLVLLLMALSKLPKTLALVIFCGMVALSLIERSMTDVSPRGLALAMWFNFASGAMTYWVLSGRAPDRYLAIVLGLVLGEAIVFNDAFAYGAVATCSVIYAAGRMQKMQSWLSGGAFQFLGKTSYSMYIFHNIIGWYALSVAMKFVPNWSALVIGITAAVVSAWAAYELIERPSIKLSRFVRLPA